MCLHVVKKINPEVRFIHVHCTVNSQIFNVSFERVNTHITSIRSSTATFTDSPSSKLKEILVNKGAMINEEEDV